MRFERRITTAGQSPYASIPFRKAVSEIRNPDGSVVFRLEGIDVPEAWSQVACDVLAQKYFRRAGVARHLSRIPERDVPEWLWRSAPDSAAQSHVAHRSLLRVGIPPGRSSPGGSAPALRSSVTRSGGQRRMRLQ